MRGESVLVVDFESDNLLSNPFSLPLLTVTTLQPTFFLDTFLTPATTSLSPTRRQNLHFLLYSDDRTS
jgi:hypothetical protein